MVAIRGRTFKKPWQRSCLSSKLKSSSAPIGREDSWCFHAVGSSNAPLLGSTAAEGLPRIGRTSIATHWRSCGLPQSASCSENFVIPPDVFGQTLSHAPECLIASVTEFGLRHLNGTLMVRHHHRHKVGIDIARWPDTHVDHHLCHRADILGEVRSLRGRRGTKRLRADCPDVVCERLRAV